MHVNLGGQIFDVAAERPMVVAFWERANAGRWEEDTLSFVRRHGGHDVVFVDIGAWIGPIALFASRHAARVLAFEPDPVAFDELTHNVQANAVVNIEAICAGLDAGRGEITLYGPGGLGRSITSSIPTKNDVVIHAKAMTFSQVTERIRANERVVCKVDIEGHEYRIIDEIIEFARSHNAPLHLSVHPRARFGELRQGDGGMGARVTAWLETRALVRKVSALRPGCTAQPSRWRLFRQIMLRHRPKNFSMEIQTGGGPSSERSA